MRVESEETVVQKVVQTFCDLCKRQLLVERCRACRRDVCRSCAVTWWRDPFSGDEAGDYPEKVCGECDAAVTDVRKECQRLNFEHYQRIDKLESAWRNARKKYENDQ